MQSRNPEFDGAFYFAVRTTGIFCRPSCASRSPKRENVSSFDTRLKPNTPVFERAFAANRRLNIHPAPPRTLITTAFEILRSDVDDIPTVDDLASRLEVSPGHLQKTFKAVLGLSPKEVTDMMRIENFKKNVKRADVTTSLYDSGFGSSRSLYEKAGEKLGMTPATYKKGGKDVAIGYTIVDSRLGKLMVAATEREFARSVLARRKRSCDRSWKTNSSLPRSNAMMLA